MRVPLIVHAGSVAVRSVPIRASGVPLTVTRGPLT
jgi:hypothetical protein